MSRIILSPEIEFYRQAGAPLMTYRPPHPNDRFEKRVRNFKIAVALLVLAVGLVIGEFLL